MISLSLGSCIPAAARPLAQDALRPGSPDKPSTPAEPISRRLPDGPLAPTSAYSSARRSADAESLFNAILETQDANGDGQISPAELSASEVSDPLADLFGQIDTDGNGTLDQAEFTKAADAIAAALKEAEPPPAPPPGRPAPGPADGADQGARNTLQVTASAMDTNGDGTVSADELAAFLADEGTGQTTTLAQPAAPAQPATSALEAALTTWAATPAQPVSSARQAQDFLNALADFARSQSAAV